ncbi:hypothetical protein P4U39_29070, partial [Bacillus paranthracis]|uniref:hypothetical protein n=1 Tax=Bacillus paranthracis TaxID=2026186 RepID=UPI002E1E2092|nr:hypothetical protein [Bacillus paranthracis]
RSEQEGVGTPDYEALFASNEGVKQPTVLAAGAGYHLKAEAPYNWALFYYHAPPSGYPPWYSPKYINDFSNISNKTQIISTIFLIYQRFDTTYRFTDNLRQGQTNYIPPPR